MKPLTKKQPTKTFSTASSKSWMMSGAIFIFALSVRIVFLFQFRSIPFFDHLFSDSQIYFTLSQQIADGRLSQRAFFMSPLYPYFIALVHTVFGNELFWVRLIQCVLGSIAAVLVFRIGKKIFNEYAGIIAGLIFAIYSLFIFYDNAILIESIQTCLFVLLIWLFLHAFDSDNMWWWIVAGIISGLMIVLRASVLLTIMTMIMYFILLSRKRQVLYWKKIIWFGAAATMMIFPWTIRNYAVEKKLIFITSSTGFNFYAGNNEKTNGEFTIPSEIDISVDPNGHRYVEKIIGRQLASTEVTSYWFHQSMNWIAAHPINYIQLLGKKFLLFWSDREIDQLGLSHAFIKKEYSTFLNLPLPGFLFVAVIGMSGIFLSFSKKKNRSYATLLLLCLVSYMISIMLFFVSGRLRVPITPIIILFAGYAIAKLYQYIKAKKWREISYAMMVSIIMFMLMTVANIDTHQSFAEEYNRLGMIAFDEKKYTDAQGYFTKSLSAGDISRVRINLANAYAAGGQLSLADNEYQKVIQSSPHNALVYFNFGNFALQVGNQKQAYLLWIKTIKEDSTFAPAYRNIAVLLSQVGKYEEAVKKFEQYLQFETDPRNAGAIRQDIENIKQILANKNRVSN